MTLGRKAGGGVWGGKGSKIALMYSGEAPVEQGYDVKIRGKTYRKMIPLNTLSLFLFNRKKIYSPYSPYSPRPGTR
jgi:hypothetical protein